MNQNRSRGWMEQCPVAVLTYAHLHLDTLPKITSHVVGLSILANLLLLLSSFPVSILPHHFGFVTVFCCFWISCVSVVTALIIHNHRFAALSILSPNEFNVGVSCGLSISAALLGFVISTVYKSLNQSCRQQLHHIVVHNSTATTTSQPTTFGLLDYLCENQKAPFTALCFWSGLSAWLNILVIALLLVGKSQITQYYSSTSSNQYESIGAITPDHHHDFEEAFRRQQAQILGEQQAREIANRSSAFVGDYANVPEVTTTSSRSGETASLTPRVLSV